MDKPTPSSHPRSVSNNSPAPLVDAYRPSSALDLVILTPSNTSYIKSSGGESEDVSSESFAASSRYSTESPANADHDTASSLDDEELDYLVKARSSPSTSLAFIKTGSRSRSLSVASTVSSSLRNSPLDDHSQLKPPKSPGAPILSAFQPIVRRRRASVSCDMASPTLPQRSALGDPRPLYPRTVIRSTVSHAVDFQFAEDLFESWSRGEFHTSIASGSTEGRSKSTFGGSSYSKWSSSSLNLRPEFDVFARIGGKKIKSLLRGANSKKRIINEHNETLGDLVSDDDDTSTLASTCGPITPLSAQFCPATQRASCYSETIEEENSDREETTMTTIPGLRLRQGLFKSSPAPRNPGTLPSFDEKHDVASVNSRKSPEPPTTILTPFVNDLDSAFVKPRTAPKPLLSDVAAKTSPEVKTARAKLQNAHRGKIASGAMSNPLPGTEDSIRQRFLHKLSINHLGFKSLGTRVKSETGHFRFTV